MMFKLRYFILIFLCLVGCEKFSQKNFPHNSEKTLHLSFSSEVRSADPRTGNEFPSAHLVRMLFDGLMRCDANGVVKPSIAQEISSSEDKTLYTFYLRECQWSDGVEVTAYDFEYAWKKSVNPKTLGHGAQNFYMIKNAQAVVEGTLPVDTLGVQALDSKTLVVELEHPSPYFLQNLCCTVFSPIPKHVDLEDSSWSYRKDQTFVCNGPYCLAQWNQSEKILLSRNPLYWDRAQVKIPKIQIDILNDPMTNLLLFEKNTLDWLGEPLSKIPEEAIPDLKKRHLLKTVDSPSIYWFFINTNKPPFNNKKIRQAFAYAINRKEIVHNLFEGEGTDAEGILSPCFELNTRPYFKDADFEEAKKLFAEGLEEMDMTKDDLPTLTLKYSNLEVLNRMSQTIQQYWNQTFGINVEIQQTDWPVHFTSIQKGNYLIGLMGWTSFSNDPLYMLQTFKYGSDLVNMSNWDCPQYRTLLNASNKVSDPTKRRDLLVQAEQLLVEEMPVIPLFFKNWKFCKNPKLQGVHLPLSGEIDFKYAYWKEDPSS